MPPKPLNRLTWKPAPSQVADASETKLHIRWATTAHRRHQPPGGAYS